MKVKMLTRNPDIYLRETIKDIHKVPRNFDPSLHPLEVPREYVKALNAIKLERVFAKPFISSLNGHKDGVSCISKHPKCLSVLLSGSYDGEECVNTIQAHEGYIRGTAFFPDGQHFLTVGDDKTIKIWESDPEEDSVNNEPIDTVVSKTILNGISHHQKDPLFATCGEACQIWEETRSEPIRTFNWGVDSLHDVAYNPIETNILGTCCSDRSVILYDARSAGPIRKIKMKLRVNKLCWNPMEAFIFTGASEDYNLYTFDIRKFTTPVYIHKDHVSAVTVIDYSPTGKEFVSGSYDKSIRIFNVHKGNSREIYHTKRMQRLSAIAWTLDNKYILSVQTK